MGNNKPLLWTAILAAAGTGSAMAQITGTPKAGDYYFKDVATGKFLGAGNKYGTQASLNGGILFTMTIEDGKYILDSKRKREAEKQYLSVVDGGNLFVDQGKCGFELVEKSAGQYVIKVGNAYLISEGNVVVTGSDEKKAAIWQILPVTDLTKAFTGASFSSPVCATPLIKTPDFSKYIDNKSGWTINGGPGLNDGTTREPMNDNPCMEFWKYQFKIDQTLNSIPNGVYRLTVQGFDRYSEGPGDATTNVRAKLFANEVSIHMPSVNREPELTNNYGGNITNAPNNMGAASSAFSAGLYKSQPLYVYVDKNTLNIGIEKKEEGGWCIFDNFELAYVSDINTDAIHKELTEKLAVVINQAGEYESDPTLQQLALDAAKIQTEINEIGVPTAKGIEYVANYLDGVKGNLGEQIDEISKKIETANKNFKAYENAMTIHAGLVEYRQTHLIVVYEAAPEAAKTAAKKTYDEAYNLVENFKTDAEQAYKDGTAGSVDYTAKKTEIEKSIDNAKTAITEGTTNEISYANVDAAITEAKNVYNDQAAKLNTLLAGASDGKTYTDTYTEALAKINSFSRQIKTIEEENNALHTANACNTETQDKYLPELEKIKTKLPTVYAYYLELVGDTKNPATGSLRANYAAACADVKALTTSLNGITYGDESIGDESIKSHYATTKSEIEAKITALQANVDAANVAHTIQSAAPFCENYKEDWAAIDKVITDLKEKVAKSVSEFTADKKSQDAITKVQGKLDDAKEKAATESDDKNYNAADKFAATATTIQEAIYAVTEARAAAYKVDGTGSAADFFTNINNDVTDEAGKVTRKGLNTIENEITAYKDDAVAALAAYNTVTAALADYDLALNGKPAVGEEGEEGYKPAEPGLKQIAVKTAVTVNGKLDGKTYAEAIAAIEARIKAVSDKLAAANDKLDAEHKAAITAIDVDAAISADIKKLVDNYKDCEDEWNKANTAAAKDRLLKDADRRVETLQLPAEYDAATYGKAAAELNNERKDFSDKKAAIEAQIESAKKSSEDADAIALLSEVVTQLETIQADLTTHTTKANTAKTEYGAEIAAKAGLDETINKLDALCNGGKVDNVEYKGIDTEAGNTGFFASEIANITALIKALQSDIATSFTNETLRADSKDVAEVKDEAGKVTTAAKDGYNTRATNIETAINNLITLAKAEKANDDDKADFDTMVTEADVDAAISKAKTDIQAAAKGDTDTAGEAFFLVELDKYEKEYKKIKDDAEAAYAAVVKSDLSGAIKDAVKYTDTSKNMTAQRSTLESSLSTVKSNIEGLKAKAEANESAYTAQTDSAVAAKTQWDAIFAEITGAEVSAAHAEAIKTLNEAKTELDTYNSNVVAAYGKGECSIKEAELGKELDDIKTKLKNLKDGWGDEYKAAVAADNAKRKTDFDSDYATLLNTYKEKTELVNKLSKLSYASESNAILAVITGKLFSYIDQIRKLKTDAEQSYATTEAPALWDAEEKNRKNANFYSQDITTLATSYSGEVNNVAMDTCKTKLIEVSQKYTDALSEIQTVLGIDEETAKNALSDVNTIITDAKKIAAQTPDDFAYVLDKDIIPAFKTIETKIAADKEKAAVSTWNKTISAATKLANKELAAIQAMGVDKIGEGGTYSKNYQKFVEESITKAATAWSEVEEGAKYAGYAKPSDLLAKFTSTYATRDITPDEAETHTANYWDAYDDEQTRIANDTQYYNMIAEVNGLQADKDAAVEFLSSLMIMHDAELNGYLNSAQTNIGLAASAAEDYKSNPSADLLLYNSYVALAKDLTNRVYDYTDAFTDKDAIAKETAAISLEIGNLYKDYDLAAAQDVENKELDTYKAEIAAFTTENKKIYDEYTKGIIKGYDEKDSPIYETAKDENGNDYNVTTTPEQARDAYVALEKKIGEVKTALTEIGDAAHIDATIASVNEAIASLQKVVDDLNAQLAECHEPVVNKFQSDVDAIVASIDAAKADLQTATDEKTILIYADNIIKTVNIVKDGNTSLTVDIKTLEDKFDANDSRYETLCGVLQKKTDKLQEVYDASLEYEFVQTPCEEYENGREYFKTIVSELIAAQQKQLNDTHNAIDENGQGGLDATTDFEKSKINEIDDTTAEMEKKLAGYNQSSTLIAASDVINAGKTKYDQVIGVSERFYPSDEVENEILDEFTRLEGLCQLIDEYARKAYSFDTTVDLDDNEFKDEEGNVIRKTYLEVYPDIMAALAQVRQDAAQFEKDAWDKSCLKGDVDNNDNITVNDYNYVRNIIIGELEYDKADPRFLAADVNGDGKINIADVIQMANKIMTGQFVPKTEAAQTRIAALVPEKTEANSLSVVAQGTGSKQFVNISLNDVANFVGAQMDVTLPAGVSLVGATAGAGQEVVFGEVDGVTRLVISNINNDGFAGNDIVTLEVEVSSDYKTGAVIVDNALFSDSRGALYIIGGGASDGATGFTELTAGEKVMNKIYSVGGQIMNSLKKGVNVIINSDGTSRKVNQK